ncbi:HTH_Tnp_Tc3_2 domain-containing protein [Trichonephila clavipes]|nr:HTH_Tnp_Tc3_2 domain-containing protein [Trichonephila clavipes]
MTVGIVWSRWVQNGNTERCAESRRPPITSNQNDRHVTRMTLMNREVMSRAVSQELRSFARQLVSAQTV